MCMRKHIHWTHFGDGVFFVEPRQVAGLGRRITAYIDNLGRLHAQKGTHYRLVHARTRWIGNDDVGMSVFSNKFLVQDILHVARVKARVGDAVDLGVDLSVFNEMCIRDRW